MERAIALKGGAEHGRFCSCGGLSGARCLDCMASLIESDVSRECHVGVLLMLASLKHNFHITRSTWPVVSQWFGSSLFKVN
jgi:hypothetical protein